MKPSIPKIKLPSVPKQKIAQIAKTGKVNVRYSNGKFKSNVKFKQINFSFDIDPKKIARFF